MTLVMSCASNKNLESNDFSSMGGGYRVFPVEQGLYFIEAKTNFAPWKNYDAARDMWLEHATKACGEAPYIELKVREYDYENVPSFLFVKYVISVKEGYVLCDTAGISSQEAEELIVQHGF